jgi:pilus assembly protein Flp/PilA
MNIRLASRRLLRNTRGANMVEYIILVGVVALISIAVFSRFGRSVATTTDNQGKTIETGINTGAGK